MKKVFKTFAMISAVVIMTTTNSIGISAATGAQQKILSGSLNFDTNNSDNSWNRFLGDIKMSGVKIGSLYGQYNDNLINDKVSSYCSGVATGIKRSSGIASGNSSKFSTDKTTGTNPSGTVTLSNSKAVFSALCSQ